MGNMKGITDQKITSALDYASGSADRTGAIIDMADYRGVMMYVKFGTIAAGATTTIKAQQDTAVGGGTMADLLGTVQAVADDNQIFIIDLYEPAERYVRLFIDKDAANATAEIAWYQQYGCRKRPVENNVTDKVTYERHMTPAEGTA